MKTENRPAPKTGNIVNFASTLRDLNDSVKPELVRSRKGYTTAQGSPANVEYIEWHSVADILDEKANGWEHSIKNIEMFGEIIAVTVAITIEGITREGVGTGSALTETGIKKAEHDALKRAAVKFGVARDLYKKNVAVREIEAEQTEISAPANPIAQTRGDMITAKQFGMIKALGRRQNIDINSECSSLLSCAPGELSKQGASFFIDHLKSLDEGTMPIAA